MPAQARRAARRSALLVTLTYAAFAALWILFSDRALEALVPDPVWQLRMQTIKGWAFVAITAALLYALISRVQRSQTQLAAREEVPAAGDSKMRRLIVAATTMLIAVILINLAYTLWQDRRDTLAEGTRQTTNLAQALDEQTRGTFNSIELTLLATERDLQLLGRIGKSNDRAVHELLLEQLKPLQFVRALFVVDAGGKMVHDTDSFPAADFNFADRPYFLAHRDRRAAGLYIGAPVQSRTRNVWFISVSRRLSHPDGSFAGVVVAAVEPMALTRFYDSLNVGRTGAVALFLEDGPLLARSPMLESALGKAFGDRTFDRQRMAQREVEISDRKSAIDGIDRIATCRHTAGRPLVVCVALGKDELLAAWRSKALAYGLISVVFMVFIGWLGTLTFCELRRRDQLLDAIRKSEERFRLIWETSNDAVQIVDTASIIHYANAATLSTFGYDPAEVLGRPLSLLQPPRLASGHASGIARYLSTGERKLNWRSVETFGQHRDGREFPVEISFSEVEFDGQRMFAGFIRDISRRKDAEAKVARMNDELEQRVRERTAQLERANQELEAFGYSVSHDLRAPVRHVDGYARLALEQSPPPDAGTRRFLEKITRSAARMAMLIDDLLSLSRAGRTELQTSRVELTKIVNDARKEALRDAGGRNIVWKIDELPAVSGDPGLLHQVFVNLLGNAIKFSAEAPAAVIEVRALLPAAAGEVRISVRDNGVGFDMQYVDKLFGVFQRLHSGDRFEGTGIGLATVRRIVERHGGRVWAESEPGKGAVFYLQLPRA